MLREWHIPDEVCIEVGTQSREELLEQRGAHATLCHLDDETFDVAL